MARLWGSEQDRIAQLQAAYTRRRVPCKVVRSVNWSRVLFFALLVSGWLLAAVCLVRYLAGLING